MRGSAKRTRRARPKPGIKVTRDLIRERLVVVKAMTAFEWTRREKLENISLPAVIVHVGARQDDLSLILEAAKRCQFKMVEMRIKGKMAKGGKRRSKTITVVAFRPWHKRGRKPGVKVGSYKKKGKKAKARRKK